MNVADLSDKVRALYGPKAYASRQYPGTVICGDGHGHWGAGATPELAFDRLTQKEHSADARLVKAAVLVTLIGFLVLAVTYGILPKILP